MAYSIVVTEENPQKPLFCQVINRADNGIVSLDSVVRITSVEEPFELARTGVAGAQALQAATKLIKLQKMVGNVEVGIPAYIIPVSAVAEAEILSKYYQQFPAV